jgi:hypothetical protein
MTGECGEMWNLLKTPFLLLHRALAHGLGEELSSLAKHLTFSCKLHVREVKEIPDRIAVIKSDLQE